MWTRADPIPPQVRSIDLTQTRHSRLLLATELEIAYRAGALALKSGLKFSDLPPIPRDAFILFRPPLAGPDGCLHLDYDLGSGRPLPKMEAIKMLGNVIDFALKLEQWTLRMHGECAVIARPLMRVDGTPSLFGFRKVTPWVWTKEMVLVVEKWSRVREREDELEAWVGDASAWIQRLKEAVGVVDAPVVGDMW